MYSVKLNRRQVFNEEKCPTLEQMRLVSYLYRIVYTYGNVNYV